MKNNVDSKRGVTRSAAEKKRENIERVYQAKRVIQKREKGIFEGLKET